MKQFNLNIFKQELENNKLLPNIGYIYFIKNKINSKYYVGQTTQNVFKRINQHILKGHKNSLIHKAIKKYGIENFEYGTLYFASKTIQELNNNEIFTIEALCSLVPNGYNILLGGLGAKNRIPWNKNKKGKQKAWNKGIYNRGHLKSVIGTNLLTKEEFYFNSATEAQRLKGFHNSWITQCCKGNKKHHKGYSWRYVNG